MKVIHLPFSKRNPYQKLLCDSLKNLGIDIAGATTYNLFKVSILDLSILNLIIKNWKPDVIHIHWQHSFLIVEHSRLKSIARSIIFLSQLIMARLLKIKIVWTVHNLKAHENVKAELELYFTTRLARIADTIIAHCDTAKVTICEELDGIKADKVFVIPHGNFNNYYKNHVSITEAKQLLGLPGQKFTFLFLGEIRYYKGVLELIDAFKQIGAVDAQLIIAGKPQGGEIIKDIQERINANPNIQTVFQFIPDDELQLYINGTDVMVFPYRDIFTSGGIQLAMSFGKAIIAPNMGCIGDTLDQDGSFLYDPQVPGSLNKVLRQAMIYKADLNDMGRHNFHLAQELDMPRIAMRTLEVYGHKIRCGPSCPF